MNFRSFKIVFSFFLFAGWKTRRTKIFFLISLLPVILALAIKINQLFSRRILIEGISVFSNIIMLFYLQFLILILALFYGTSVCSEEVEGKTLTYLATRPVSKSSLILGKYAAYTLFLILMVACGTTCSFLILNIERILDGSLWVILWRDVAVLSLGLMGYTAFFTFIGTFLKKSVLFGLFYCFGWENVIQYFPGSTQRFAIAHYLKSLLPVIETSTGRFSFLLFRLEPSPPGLAVATLCVITGVFLGLACLVFSQKEYIFED
ncbi:MAG: ABC transporter permease [Candidatus Aminicenantales bacterium]